MASQQKPPPAPHSSKQRLALAICHFLNASTTDGTLTAEDKDSVDIAVNCIADSFKVEPTDQSAMDAAVGSQSLLQIYSVYEKLKEGPSAPNSSVDPSATEAPTEEQKKEAESLKSKGNAAMVQRHYATAIDLYTQALRLNPSNAVFLSNRAAAHSAARDHSSALIDAEAAVALDPTYTKAWSRLGLARFALGDPKGAMEAYQKGIHYEGNGGSDAMRRGYETAKCRTEEVAQSDPQTVPQAAADNDSVSRGGSGGGGMPDLSAIMNNPLFANMAQNLMSNPDLMGNLMSNPRLRDMADQFTQGGGMPDLSSLMSDPNIAEMARNMMGGRGNSSNSNNNNGGSGGDP